YSIQSYDGHPAAVRALKVQRGTGTTNASLYVAYYPSAGSYLSALGSQIHSGAIIHYEDSQTPGGKLDLLDFTQTTPIYFRDPARAVNQTWVDPSTDLSITVNSATADTLTVTVNSSTPPCTQAAPTLSFSPTSGSVLAGSPFNFSVTVLN